MKHLFKPNGALCQTATSKRLGWSKQKLNGFITGYRAPTAEQLQQIKDAIRDLLTVTI